MKKALVYCIKLRKDNTETPRFKLEYLTLVREYYADHIGVAVQIARFYLNENNFREIEIEYKEKPL